MYLVLNAMTILGKQRILMGNSSSIDNLLIMFKQLTGDQSCTFKIQTFPRQRENWQYPVISFVWPDVTSTSDNVELGMLPIQQLDRINRLLVRVKHFCKFKGRLKQKCKSIVYTFFKPFLFCSWNTYLDHLPYSYIHSSSRKVCEI